MSARRIIVVGAGLAGLSCAWRLQQAGHQVQVLEARSQPGGRMAMRQSGPISYNTGARLIYPFGDDLHGLIAELGLRNALVPLKNLRATCRHLDSDYHVDLMPSTGSLFTPGLNWADRLRLVRSAITLARLRRRVDPDDATSALAYDDETLAAYIERTAGPRVLERLIDPVFRGTRCWNPTEISAVFYVSTMPHLLGRDTVYTMAQGIGQLTQMLAAQMNVRCGAAVESLQRAPGGGCEVRYRVAEQVIDAHADVVVCAVEGALAKTLVRDPGPEERALLDAVRYNQLGIVHYALRGDLPATLEFAARGAATQIATWQQTPAHIDGAGERLVSLYCQLTPEAVLAAQQHGMTECLDMLIGGEVRARIPDLDSRMVHRVNQWIPYMLPVFYPGYGRTVARYLSWQSAQPRSLYYCGDYLSQALLGGACHSGTNVARAILRG